MRGIMKGILFLLMFVGLFGCATVDNISNLRLQNRQRLMQLEVGMTKKEVMEVMGEGTAENKVWQGAFYGGWATVDQANNPYRSETLQGKDKVFLVWYYYTDVKNRDGAVTDDELTPVVFDKGKVIGWGWGFLEKNVQKYEIRVR